MQVITEGNIILSESDSSSASLAAISASKLSYTCNQHPYTSKQFNDHLQKFAWSTAVVGASTYYKPMNHLNTRLNLNTHVRIRVQIH